MIWSAFSANVLIWKHRCFQIEVFFRGQFGWLNCLASLQSATIYHGFATVWEKNGFFLPIKIWISKDRTKSKPIRTFSIAIRSRKPVSEFGQVERRSNWIEQKNEARFDRPNAFPCCWTQWRLYGERKRARVFQGDCLPFNQFSILSRSFRWSFFWSHSCEQRRTIFPYRTQSGHYHLVYYLAYYLAYH